MNLIYYLLEANLYLAVFYAVYRLFLHKETFYSLNRGYLVLSTLLAFTFPLLQVGYLFSLFGFRQQMYMSAITHQQVVQTDYLSVYFLLPAVYLLVTAILFLLLTTRITRIIVLAIRAKRQRIAQVRCLELEGEQTAFSFFNLLFINPNISDKETVIRHELVHIRQKHSLDVLFFELVQIIGWFNPITYFYQKDIKLLHEYIADELTTRVAVPKHDYAMLLIQNSFGAPSNPLTNQIFNQSVLKKRITMLNKQKSSVNARFKLLLVLPLAGGMICMSTMAFSKDYGILDLYPVKGTVLQDTSKRVPPPPPTPPVTSKASKTNKVKFPPPVVRPNKTMAPPPPPVEPRPAKSLKKNQIKFPPPVVRPDKTTAPPPPPIEPPSLKEATTVKVMSAKPTAPKKVADQKISYENATSDK